MQGIVLRNSSKISNLDSDTGNIMRNAVTFQKGALKNFFCSHHNENDRTDPVGAFKNAVH